MKGTRVETWRELTDTKGAYMKDREGTWWAHAPTHNFIGNLGGHEIIEHDDGTITVSPSILCWQGEGAERKEYHGYLKAGEWSNA